VQASHTTGAIRHNARAMAADTGSDGTSMQEMLEALPNVGELNIVRSAVNVNTGGYTWTITFIRGATSAACTDADNAVTPAGSDGCPSPGNVPDFSSTITSLWGTNAATAHAETTPGNVLRGNVQLQVTGTANAGTFAAFAWDASNAAVKTALEGLVELTSVEVTRVRVGKYGGFTWFITFTENPGQTPPGSGDMPILICDLSAMTESDGTSTSKGETVTETNAGSVGLSGTFTVQFNNAPEGLQTLNFDATALEVETALQALGTVSDVHVTRQQDGAGWGANPVNPDSQWGGYRWIVTFVSNNGNYLGRTFPPGSGNMAAIATTHSLGGTSADAPVSEDTAGSEELGGTFTLAYSSDASTSTDYDSSAVTVKTRLDDLSTIGSVTTSRYPRTTQLLTGSVAINTGEQVATSTADLTAYVSPGDIIRIGGEGGNSLSDSLPGSNGDELLAATGAITNGATSLVTSADVRSKVYDGATVRIFGDEYTVSVTGTEVKTIVLNSDIALSQGSFKLTFTDGSATAATTASCLSFDATADQVKAELELLANVGTVSVAKTVAGVDSTYTIYFDSATNAGLQGTLVGADVGTGTCAAFDGGATVTVDAAVVSAGAGDGLTFTISPAFAEDTTTAAPIYLVAQLFTVRTGATFDATTLPLGTLANAANAATYVGPPKASVTVFKQNGFNWLVKYDTNIGDTQALVSDVTALTGASKAVTVYDNFVTGVLPAQATLTSLKQGVPYYIRVSAHNSLGYGTPSDPPAVQTPMQEPSAPTSLVVNYAPHVDEVQTFQTVATHIDEIQTLTTSARHVDEVQSIALIANTGATVAGKFALTYDGWSTKYEIQTLTLTATTSIVTAGAFKINIDGPFVTGCINWDATAADIKTALELGGGRTVVVDRKDVDFGAVITIGLTDSGDIATHTITDFGSGAGAAFVGGAAHAHAEATLLNEGVNLNFNDAPAVVETALLALPNVEKMSVGRSLADLESGYVFTFTFVDAAGNLPEMTCDTDAAFQAVAGAACTPSTVIDGNMIGGDFTVTFNGVTSAVIAASASQADMTTALQGMFTIGTVTTTRSAMDTEGGYTWNW
jgi:hypothetical protein